MTSEYGLHTKFCRDWCGQKFSYQPGLGYWVNEGTTVRHDCPNWKPHASKQSLNGPAVNSQELFDMVFELKDTISQLQESVDSQFRSTQEAIASSVRQDIRNVVRTGMSV